MNIDQFIDRLNDSHPEIRLESLRGLKKALDAGEIKKPPKTDFVNNHIHTTYSFSPYSPTKAIWMAYQAGLSTAGIMDHDSISGAREFIEAGKILGIATTIGMECRVHFADTPLNEKRINNPDQATVVYMALHSIPHTQIDAVTAFLEPYREARNRRNRLMTLRLNELFAPYDIDLDFEWDIVPLSEAADGGSITERHLLFALSKKIVRAFGKGEPSVLFLKNDLKLNISAKLENLLRDPKNPFYDYDLLGVLKSELVEHFYIPATDECPDVRTMIDFAARVGAVSAYAYLGDVGDSVTGDKKAQKFEDDFLDLLFDVLKDLKFNAVTYMPSRNSIAQLQRLKSLCDRYGFFQISGEDINSPRQSFVCEVLTRPEFRNLIDSTWALIGHEKAATADLQNGMFSEKTLARYLELSDRIKRYKQIGQEKY